MNRWIRHPGPIRRRRSRFIFCRIKTSEEDWLFHTKMLALNEFSALAKNYNVIPMCRDIVLDRHTPVSVYERLAAKQSHSFLLESVEGGEQFGRYSIVG